MTPAVGVVRITREIEMTTYKYLIAYTDGKRTGRIVFDGAPIVSISDIEFIERRIKEINPELGQVVVTHFSRFDAPQQGGRNE